MFSIAAINDVDISQNNWQPLAPTKEAQEFHLTQMYNESLAHLQAEEYTKAQKLFQAIIDHPLSIKAQRENKINSDPMLQLRFLAFRNLAEAFLKQGEVFYKDALQAFLEAVSIDEKDIVLWNRLGTLACSLGLFSIARWAFEQGLQCSPHHWSCMEKLVEVLIAIGDEAACLSIVKRLLKISPSHPRAELIRCVIEDNADVNDVDRDNCGVPEKYIVVLRGIDKLKPQHYGLTFSKKRKSDDLDICEPPPKRVASQRIYVKLAEASWAELVNKILRAYEDNILKVSVIVQDAATGYPDCKPKSDTLTGQNVGSEAVIANAAVKFQYNKQIVSESETDKSNMEVDVLELNTQSNCTQSEAEHVFVSSVSNYAATLSREEVCSHVEGSSLSKVETGASSKHDLPSDAGSDRCGITRDKETSTDEEPPLERRSTRLERIRTRKFDKSEEVENMQMETSKIKKSFEHLMELLEPFIVCTECIGEISSIYSSSSEEEKCIIVDNNEENDVLVFLREHDVNSGLCHVAQHLLEKLPSIVKPLESWGAVLHLEKCIRGVSKGLNAFCSLFLAELYMDMAASAASESERTNFIEDCDFHLCKILDCFAATISSPDISWHDMPEFSKTFHVGEKMVKEVFKNSVQSLDLEHALQHRWWPFWARFYWISGCLRYFQGSCEKGRVDFQQCQAVLEAMEHFTKETVAISLIHCRNEREISLERVKHKLYELQIQELLTNSAARLVEQGQHEYLIEHLAPILFPENDVEKGTPLALRKKHANDFSTELTALNMLIEACECTGSKNFNVALKCYIRKMQIHFLTAGFSCKRGTDNYSCSVIQDGNQLHSNIGEIATSVEWFNLVAEEVKLICKFIAGSGQQIIDKSLVVSVDGKLLGHMQQLLLKVMCHTSAILAIRRASGPAGGSSDSLVQLVTTCFVNAAVAFCRLQHLFPKISIKLQVELLVTMHDILAEYELCCAGKGCEGGEGVFLKMAIKHLLSLEMKLKSGTSQMVNLTKVSSAPDKVDDFASEERRLSIEENLCNPENEEVRDATGDSELIQVKTSKQKDTVPNSEACAEIPRKIDTSDDVEEQACNTEEKKMDLGLDIALDQSFYCLYGLNLRSGLESAGHDGLAVHANTSLGDYQSKEQCAEVFQYLLPYARVCTKANLAKLRKVLRAIRKHFREPSSFILENNVIDSFLDNVECDETELSSMVLNGSSIEEILKLALKTQCYKVNSVDEDITRGSSWEWFMNNVSIELEGIKFAENLNKNSENVCPNSEPYHEVYRNLYYLLTQVEETSASDKWPGFVFTKEGEEFVEQNIKLCKYDLLYNPLRFESWNKLANLYDEEVDLMLNDGSKTCSAAEWHKNSHLTKRVQTGRQRTRRCLLMSLALAKSPEQQSQVHELLALVYYDSIQNVAPSYNQRQHVAVKDAMWKEICKKSYMHFEKALLFKSEWLYLFYLGKLCEKMGQPCEKALSYYKKAVDMNPCAVDPLYRLHASRLKLLCCNGTSNVQIIQVIANFSYLDGTNEKVVMLLDKYRSERNDDKSAMDTIFKEVWDVLFEDSVKALEVCIEGELKHYHKARYRLAQGLLVRNRSSDIERAKEELGFCFKSNRSLFTINMWEIDGSTKRNRRKTPGSAGARRGFEISMPESSRKFITCLRKYLLLYFHVCEKTFDLCTLERAYSSLRVDKKFSLCLADMIHVALGKYIHTLAAAIHHLDMGGSLSNFSLKNLLERFFSLFMELGSSWSDSATASLVEAGLSSSEIVSENAIYSYIHRHLQGLEWDNKVDVLESVNEKIRKRFKASKLVNEQCARVSKHAAMAWCRALCVSLATITPLSSESASPESESSIFLSDTYDQLVVDLQVEELMSNSSSFCEVKEGIDTSKQNSYLLAMSAVKVKQAITENMDKASTLLRQTYIFYRDCSGPFPSGIHLFLLPSGSAELLSSSPSSCPLVGVDLSVPRKLLLWAYNLVHGHTCTIAEAVKFCEDQAKNKMRRLPSHSSPSLNFQEKSTVTAPKEASISICTQFTSPGVADEREKTLPEDFGNMFNIPPSLDRPQHCSPTLCLTNRSAEDMMPADDNTETALFDFVDSHSN